MSGSPLRHIAQCLTPGAVAAGDKEELYWISIAEATERFAAGTLTPVELLEACMARLDATEDRLNSFVKDMRLTAMQQAEASTARWKAGAPLGPLDGVPICVKDIYDTEGVVTAGGCWGLRDRVPEEDCHSVALLRAGGAVFVGKAFTVEFASGGLLNPHYRSNPDGSAVVTPNPWNVKHQPGGSSSGTASAVAAGQVLAGTGSCTGGSIRGPSAYCNLSGIKPTYGLVSKRGVMALSKTLDHAGPMCRTAKDCAMFLDAMKGFDPKAASYDSLPAPDPEEVITESLDGSVPAGAYVMHSSSTWALPQRSRNRIAISLNHASAALMSFNA